MNMIAVQYDWLGAHFGQIAISLLPLALPVFAPMLAFHKENRIDRIGWYTSGFL